MKKLILPLLLFFMGIIQLAAAGPSGTLPVIHINIKDGAEVTSKEYYLKATYWFEPNGAEGMEAVGTAEAPLPLQIKGRGNYTFTGFEKKPYRLKLDKKQPLGGMASSKHFGLLAHADDFRGFLRNTMGFKISKDLGLPWTPEQQPVEVIINGSYRGLYFLVELIRIDKKRVNITAWEEEDAEGNSLPQWIEGGSLIEIDNYDEEGQVVITDGDGEPMRITYDKSVDPGYEPTGYRDWLRDQFQTMNTLIFGDKNSDEIWNYLDIDDCARFMLVQEISNNYESFHGSCYMHREKGEGEKWHFSPVWDFGSAFFVDNYPNNHFWQSGMHHNHWAAQLWQFPRLQEKMAELWHQYRDNGFDDLTPFAQDFLNLIKSGAASDKERWPQYGNDNLNEKYEYAKRFLNGARSYLNHLFPGGGNDDPSEFVVPYDEDCVYHVFFKRTGKALEWENVKIFYWDSHFNHIEWPGEDCEKVLVKGNEYWHYRLTASEERDDYMLLFDNGRAGKNENQTYDLKVRKRGVYTLDMPDHAEPSMFLEEGAGASDVRIILEKEDGSGISIKALNGALGIYSERETTLTIHTVAGTANIINVPAGTTVLELPKGLYIVEGKKYIL